MANLIGYFSFNYIATSFMYLIRHIFSVTLLALCLPVWSQKINGELFIPLNNRSEIWLKPKIDTLDNKKEYEFKIRVAPEYKISQFLFEKGLAVQNDSVLKIIPNSTKYGQCDTAVLRVIVTSITGSRIFLFQKAFIIKVPERIFPVVSNPKTNLMLVNDRTYLERNRPYPKSMFVDKQPFFALYDNEANMSKMDVKGVTMALYEKEGKQYISEGDTLTTEAMREIKKIKDPTPVFFKIDAYQGKSRKVVWNRVVIYAE
ncbi:MAG: hypothetical protein U0V74_06545 [Chitinophagales bacterium]